MLSMLTHRRRLICVPNNTTKPERPELKPIEKNTNDTIAMNQTAETKHFTLVHHTKRRVRIIAPSLRKDQERAYVLEILLCKRQGIEVVKIVPAIASVTIYFDPECLPVANLLQLLEAVITNIGLKPRHTINAIKHKNAHPSESFQDFVIGIGGMSCASCALFLEMVLQREPDIITATVNYVSETASVKGYLDKETLFKIISANGYQAFSIDTLAERKLLFELERKHLITAKKQLITLGMLSLPVTLLSIFGSKSRVPCAVAGIIRYARCFLGRPGYF